MSHLLSKLPGSRGPVYLIGEAGNPAKSLKDNLLNPWERECNVTGRSAFSRTMHLDDVKVHL